MTTAIEFFSGIGAFAEAAHSRKIEVVAAFDIDQRANQTYELNFRLKPTSRNLDTITFEQLPDADIWWLSPPCQPYSVRGNQRGLCDPRSKSFQNLLELVKVKKPKVFLLENVLGFKDSDGHSLTEKTLTKLGYELKVLELSPSEFGVPMRRPRLYIVATSGGAKFEQPVWQIVEPKKLRDFISKDFSPELLVRGVDFEKYGRSLHIVDPEDPDSYAICFTSGYWKSYKSSGTFVYVGANQIRRFSAEEIVRLMGFSEKFTFPESLSLQAKLQLVGNTVDVRAIDYLLNGLSKLV